MRLVTYDAGAGPRVGALDGDGVVDVGCDGDMVAFIAAGAPVAERAPVPSARLLAPLRPRSLRDFLAFEGHMKDALTRLGRAIPDEWYDVPAYYKGMPDTVIGPGREIPWPAWTDRLDHELELAAVIGPRRARTTSPAEARRGGVRLDDLERPVGARRAGARAADRHGPGQGQGLGRLERARPVHRHRRRARRLGPAHERARQRRDVGRGPLVRACTTPSAT